MNRAMLYLCRLLNEESDSKMNAEQMAERIGNDIKEIFPKSYVRSYVLHHLGTSIDVRFTLGDKGEWANNIINNDPAHTMMMIGFDQINKDGSLQDKITAEQSIGGLIIKPEPGSHMARGRVRVIMRKKTDTPEKIVKHVKDYFLKLKETIKSNIDNMMDDDAKLAKTKI